MDTDTLGIDGKAEIRLGLMVREGKMRHEQYFELLKSCKDSETTSKSIISYCSVAMIEQSECELIGMILQHVNQRHAAYYLMLTLMGTYGSERLLEFVLKRSDDDGRFARTPGLSNFMSTVDMHPSSYCIAVIIKGTLLRNNRLKLLLSTIKRCCTEGAGHQIMERLLKEVRMFPESELKMIIPTVSEIFEITMKQISVKLPSPLQVRMQRVYKE